MQGHCVVFLGREKISLFDRRIGLESPEVLFPDLDRLGCEVELAEGERVVDARVVEFLRVWFELCLALIVDAFLDLYGLLGFTRATEDAGVVAKGFASDRGRWRSCEGLRGASTDCLVGTFRSR